MIAEPHLLTVINHRMGEISCPKSQSCFTDGLLYFLPSCQLLPTGYSIHSAYSLSLWKMDCIPPELQSQQFILYTWWSIVFALYLWVHFPIDSVLRKHSGWQLFSSVAASPSVASLPQSGNYTSSSVSWGLWVMVQSGLCPLQL